MFPGRMWGISDGVYGSSLKVEKVISVLGYFVWRTKITPVVGDHNTNYVRKLRVIVH